MLFHMLIITNNEIMDSLYTIMKKCGKDFNSKRNKEFSPFCDEGQRSIPWNFMVAFGSLYYVSLKFLSGFNKKVHDEWRVPSKPYCVKVYPSTEKSITKVATFLRFFLWSVHLYSRLDPYLSNTIILENVFFFFPNHFRVWICYKLHRINVEI